MSRACSVCMHPQRPHIDRQLAWGVSVRHVARRYGLSKSAVWRHARLHELRPSRPRPTGVEMERWAAGLKPLISEFDVSRLLDLLDEQEPQLDEETEA